MTDREFKIKIAQEVHEEKERRMQNPYYREQMKQEENLIKLQGQMEIDDLVHPPYSENDDWKVFLGVALFIIIPVACWVAYLG